VQTNTHATPKTIPAHCSFIKGTSGWIVTASGGVEVNAWQIVSEASRVDPTLLAKRAPSTKLTTASADQWWWD